MIKIFVSLLAMFTIDAIVSYLQKRDNTSSDITQNDNNYVVPSTCCLNLCIPDRFRFRNVPVLLLWVLLPEA